MYTNVSPLHIFAMGDPRNLNEVSWHVLADIRFRHFLPLCLSDGPNKCRENVARHFPFQVCCVFFPCSLCLDGDYISDTFLITTYDFAKWKKTSITVTFTSNLCLSGGIMIPFRPAKMPVWVVSAANLSGAVFVYARAVLAASCAHCTRSGSESNLSFQRKFQ